MTTPNLTIFLCIFSGLPLLANTLVVTTAEDQLDSPSGSEISLREAIRDAEDSASTITFAPSLNNAVLELDPARGPLQVTDPDNSTSPGFTGQLTINATALALPPRISAPSLQASEEAAIIVSGRPTRIRNLVIENSGHGGIYVDEVVSLNLEEVDIRHCDSYAIRFSGLNLSMTQCEIYGNISNRSESNEIPAIWFDNGFTLNMVACSVYQNSGRGIFAEVTTSFGRKAELFNVTLAENTTISPTGSYGGLYIEGPLSTSARYCTIVDNGGGGIGAVGTNPRLYSSIVTRNRKVADGSPLDVSGNTISQGYNLCDLSPSALDENTDITGVDTKISRLGFYGGGAPVCYPLVGSPAIEAGNSSATRVSEENIDGRGYVRQIEENVNSRSKNFIDIGAVEINPSGNSTFLISETLPAFAASLQKQLEVTNINSERRLIFESTMNGQVFDFSSSIITIPENTQFVVDASGLDDSITIGNGGSGSIVLSAGSSLTLHNVNISGEIEITTTVDSTLGLSCVNASSVVGNLVELTGSTRAILNECDLEDKGDEGGAHAGISTSGSSQLQVWNSSFSNFLPRGNQDGGVIQNFSNRFLELYNVTFQNNEHTRLGAAFYSANGLTAARYCSIFDCQSQQGAFAFGTNASSRISSCLFDGNSNGDGGVPDADLFYPAGLDSRHSVIETFTTSTVAFSGFGSGLGNGINTNVNLLPFENYGGKVRVRPQADDSALINDLTIISNPRALDALGQQRPTNGIETPGSAYLAPGGNAFAIIESIERTANSVILTINRTSESAWTVYAGIDLSQLTETTTTIPSSAPNPTSVTVPLPAVAPGKYFLQLRSE